ncbi:MAG: DUF983 domain-containing protein [Cytophagales bacterium]|nr:DUF983 domain-containing protein [Cytophagales bacterium]MDW8383833.1 DUF983 domain-containing protein [Flammeovirgaceae bacterium]
MLNYWKAIFQKKCPRCRKGDIFKYRGYQLSHYLNMYDRCSYCGQNFMPEPGFYIGAIYIAYALNVALVISSFTALMILTPKRPELWIILTTTITPVVLLFPFVTRLARSMMLHFFGGIQFDDELTTQKENQEEINK